MRLTLLFLLLNTAVFAQAKQKSAPTADPVFGQVYEYPDEAAEFPGGTASLMKFISENATYPEMCAGQGGIGKLYSRFIVDSSGKLHQITATRPTRDCPEWDEELKRVIQLMPPWKPGSVDGKPVSSYYTLSGYIELR